MDTTDDYHVYRLIVASTTYELYVDGVLRNFGSSIASGGAKVIQFRGDSNGLAGMETSWDYVYYSTATVTQTLPRSYESNRTYA